MPCMGPSQDAAHDEGRRLTVEILELLDRRGVRNNGLDEANGRFSFDDKLKTRLLEVIQEIVWDDYCASF